MLERKEAMMKVGGDSSSGTGEGFLLHTANFRLCIGSEMLSILLGCELNPSSDCAVQYVICTGGHDYTVYTVRNKQHFLVDHYSRAS